MNRKLLVAIVSGVLAAPMAAQVQADEHESHTHSELHEHGFSISGHLGRAIVITDSGDTDVSHGDMGASPSRFRVTASEELDGGITAGMSLEYGAGNNANANPNLRQAHIYLSGDFGRLAIGQQSSATDGVAYANFNGAAALGGVEVGCDYCSADFITAYGHGRAEGVKYTTPGIGPASPRSVSFRTRTTYGMPPSPSRGVPLAARIRSTPATPTRGVVTKTPSSPVRSCFRLECTQTWHGAKPTRMIRTSSTSE